MWPQNSVMFCVAIAEHHLLLNRLNKLLKSSRSLKSCIRELKQDLASLSEKTEHLQVEIEDLHLCQHDPINDQLLLYFNDSLHLLTLVVDIKKSAEVKFKQKSFIEMPQLNYFIV